MESEAEMKIKEIVLSYLSSEVYNSQSPGSCCSWRLQGYLRFEYPWITSKPGSSCSWRLQGYLRFEYQYPWSRLPPRLPSCPRRLRWHFLDHFQTWIFMFLASARVPQLLKIRISLFTSRPGSSWSWRLQGNKRMHDEIDFFGFWNPEMNPE